MHDNDYMACGTKRVDMRRRIIAQMVNSPRYMAAIPLTVADLRAEGDHEGADQLERLAVEAQRRINAMNKPVAVSAKRARWPQCSSCAAMPVRHGSVGVATYIRPCGCTCLCAARLEAVAQSLVAHPAAPSGSIP